MGNKNWKKFARFFTLVIILLMRNVILFLSFSVLISGCAFHTGVMMNSASLGQPNFAYIKWSADGSAKAISLFGIGGLGKEALVEEAKKDLISRFPIKENQAYVNITVNFKRTFILIYMEQKCTVTASIVQFIEK